MSFLDTSKIGQAPLTGPRAKRRHVRSLTGSLRLHIWGPILNALYR